MYEVLIRLYYELDYHRFKVEELKEIKNILQQYKGQVMEVKLKKLIKEEKNNGS